MGRDRDVVSTLTQRLILPWRKIAGWIIANAMILQLVLAPMAMLLSGGTAANQDGAITFALCTHGDDAGGLPAGDNGGAACQLCLICGPVSLLPELSRVPVASLSLKPVQWIGLPAAIEYSRRLSQERSRGPPLSA
jgi:hypothetical protein